MLRSMDLEVFLEKCEHVRWSNESVLDGLGTSTMFVVATHEGKHKKALRAIQTFLTEHDARGEWSVIDFCGKLIVGRSTS